MTILGYRISDECEKIVVETEKRVKRRVLYANEPLEGDKIKLGTQGSYFYYANFDMNRIDIGSEFEPLLIEMMHIIEEFDRSSIV